MRSFRHWTGKYLLNRIRDILYQKRYPHHPWLTPCAISVLSSYLRPSDVGLEWGSGRSTIWLARRVARLTSTEHDPLWFRRIAGQLKKYGMTNVRYLHREAKDGNRPECDSPYVRVANMFHRESLDFVLVDGKARSACALAALEKLRPGAVLILDNANWYLPCRSHSPNSRTEHDGPASEQWGRFLERVALWRRIWTSNGVTDTAMFLKPANDDEHTNHRPF